jgi:hypothetical protein
MKKVHCGAEGRVCMVDTLSGREVDAIHIFLFKRTTPIQIEVYKKSRFFQEVNALARAGDITCIPEL